MIAKRIALIAALIAGASAPVIVATTFSACSTTPTQSPLRSLERSGRVVFACLDVPTVVATNGAVVTNPAPGLDVAACASAPEATTDGGVVINPGPQVGANLFAMVTQTTRGEIAVVNLSSGEVVDEDPSIPGANFLPVGAQPTDIVVTPKATAAFVSVGQVAHQGIFALPAPLLRPGDPGRPPPSITDWPACALPAAPGQMVLISDPATADGTRSTCDGAYGASTTADAGGVDGGAATGAYGEIDAEGNGRQKLVVTLPALGGIAVIDAQDVLDRQPGSFDNCTIERWVPLAVKLPPPAPLPPTPQTEGCVVPSTNSPFTQSSFTSQPAGISYGGGRLYIADLKAPVIHVVDMATPCNPIEVDPLLPTSVDDPTRVVATSHVSVAANLTVDKKRFLYAVDEYDRGSVIIFDVTPGAPRTPVHHPFPELNPNVPQDRIRFAAPVRDILLAPTRDIPIGNGFTGAAPVGTLCDPVSSSMSLGRNFETAPDYTLGAGPNVLRGTFAFLLLSTGSIATIDLDDYDAPCRVPFTADPLLGCQVQDGGTLVQNTGATLESSCGVVERHAPRSAFYLLDNNLTGIHEPGIASFPLLTDLNGSAKTFQVLDADAGTGTTPRMVATLPNTQTNPARVPTSPVCAGLVPQIMPQTDPVTMNPLQCPGFGVAVGGSRAAISTDRGLSSSVNGDPEHVLAMNLEDPRAQSVDQNWTVAYEGALPGFTNLAASLQPAAGSDGGAPVTEEWLVDSDGNFCTNGVHSLKAALETLPRGSPIKPDDLADYVQINSELPLPDDPYWNTVGSTCDYNACTTSFGSVQAPEVGRDFEILEAYNDHLVIKPRPKAPATTVDDAGAPAAVSYELTKCCFHTQIFFNIRGGSQWIVTGDQVAIGNERGFLHHVVASPIDGTCRDSCDTGSLARMNGRAFTSPAGTVHDGDPYAFINPMFRFAILAGTSQPVRDDRFTFATQGSFISQSIPLTIDNQNVDPQSIVLAPTGEIAVADGALQGLILVNPSVVSLSRQFF